MFNAHINIATTFQSILLWKYNMRSWFWFNYCKWMRDKLKSTEYHYIKYDVKGEGGGEENKQLKKASLPSYIKEDLADLDDHNKSLKGYMTACSLVKFKDFECNFWIFTLLPISFPFQRAKGLQCSGSTSITNVGFSEPISTHSFPFGNSIRMLQVLQIHIFTKLNTVHQKQAHKGWKKA